MTTRMPRLLGVFLFAAYLTGCGGGGGGGDSLPNSPIQQVDTTKPVVNSTTPAHNSVAVNTNSAITVTFNEPVDPATITTNSFIVVADGTGAVTGTVTYEESSKTAIFRHDLLSPNTVYTATVTTAVKDLSANAMGASYSWQFTTGGTSDTTPPTVLYKFPASNSGGVAMNTVVAATFSEAIDPATINAQTLTLMKDGVTQVAGSMAYVGTTALFIPTGNLLPGASYTVQITVGVMDLAKNTLAENFAWSFTTGSESDLQSPQVLSVSPPDGAQNVPANSTLVVSFNEPILPFEFGLIDGRPVEVSFDATYTTVTMKPTMHSGSTYTSYIKMRDMAGNQMPVSYSWRYSTSP